MTRIFLFLLLFGFTLLHAQVQVAFPRVENLNNPIGLDVTTPRFGWQLRSEQRNILQTACEIRVANTAAGLVEGKKIFWQTGKINSDASVWVPYAGPALESGKKYWWQVRVWDNTGQVSAWSDPAFWQMGLLQASDWKAQWISVSAPEDSTRPSPMFRKEFIARKKIASATAYITAHGLFEARINGRRVGPDYLTPGWTAYQKRIPYLTYDVTSLLQTGSNAIGVTLGNGWWRGNIGWAEKTGFMALIYRYCSKLTFNSSMGAAKPLAPTDPGSTAQTAPSVVRRSITAKPTMPA